MSDLDAPIYRLIENLPFPVFLIEGDDLRVVRCSRVLAAALGYEESPPPVLALAAFGDAAAVESVGRWLSRSGEKDSLDIAAALKRKDGQDLAFFLEVRRMDVGGRSGALCLARRRLWEGRFESEGSAVAADYSKRDALALVSESMAHEVNNPLQVIFGNAELALLVNKNPELVTYLREIIVGAERVRAAVASLRALNVADKVTE